MKLKSCFIPVVPQIYPKEKGYIFLYSKKEKGVIAVATTSFYFEEERKIGLFNWVNLGYKWYYTSCTSNLSKRKRIYFSLFEKGVIDVATANFYFEEERKI